MKVQDEDSIIDYENLLSDDLIDYISFKNDFPKEAEMAFVVFCDRFQKDILQKAEIFCDKFGYNETVAFDIVNCAFSRVWKYHSFKKEKSKSKDIDIGIKLWLYSIVYNEMVKYGLKNTCSEPEEDDLSIIESLDDLIIHTVGEDLERRKDLKIRLEIIVEAMNGLTEKHKIIYLTYKAYENNGKNIPRSVGKKLRERLNLVQNSIQVYKKEATDKVNNYLKYINGN